MNPHINPNTGPVKCNEAVISLRYVSGENVFRKVSLGPLGGPFYKPSLVLRLPVPEYSCGIFVIRNVSPQPSRAPVPHPHQTVYINIIPTIPGHRNGTHRRFHHGAVGAEMGGGGGGVHAARNTDHKPDLWPLSDCNSRRVAHWGWQGLIPTRCPLPLPWDAFLTPE